MRYVALPVEIDAWLWTGNRSDLPESEWESGAYAAAYNAVLIIDTLEGPARALPNLHYVAVGTEGERYPIHKDVFHKKYAAVAEQ